MKINWMRFWDYWIGRPICFILSIYLSIKEKVQKKKISNGQPDKVLFIKLFGVGSIILSYSAVASFKKSYPESKLFFLTFNSNKEIIEILNMVEVNNIVTIRNDSLFHLIFDVFKALRFLRGEKIGWTVDFEFFSRFTAIFAVLTGALYRVGYYNYHTEGLSRGRTINVPVAYNHTKHTSQVFLHLVQKIGVKRVINEIPFVSNEYELPEELNRFEKRIIFNVNSSDMIRLRNWPLENFAMLANLVLDRFEKAVIVFIGTNFDNEHVRNTIDLIKNHGKSSRVFNLAGKTTLKELIGLFNKSNTLITVDSGPAHIASLTNIKIITLFGPETPVLYRPLSRNAKEVYLDIACQPCVSVYNGKRSHCTNNICMQNIKPEVVLNMI